MRMVITVWSENADELAAARAAVSNYPGVSRLSGEKNGHDPDTGALVRLFTISTEFDEGAVLCAELARVDKIFKA